MKQDFEKETGVKTDVIELNMGPQHPSTHGVMRIVLELDGEVIVKAKPVIGYLHRGTEKIAEHRAYYQVVPYTDRLDYLAPMSNELGYVMAVEKLLGIEVPIRAQFLRVILAELARIASHLVWLGSNANDIGAVTVFLYAFREREKIYDLLEAVSGQRMNNAFLKIGGLMGDVPEGWIDEVKKFIKQFPEKLKDPDGLLTKNKIWKERTEGIGVIPRDLAIDLSLTGPPLRASGVKRDLRKDTPYLVYDQFDFDVPVETAGDVYARYLVRMEEMRQSVRIIEQAIEKLPGGPVLIDNYKIVPPPKDKVYRDIPELIHHFKLISEGFHPPKGEVYFAVEAPKGELGYYIVSNGSNKPYRLRIRPPSFVNLQALEYILPGHLIADAVAIIGSLDPVFGEVDR